MRLLPPLGLKGRVWTRRDRPSTMTVHGKAGREALLDQATIQPMRADDLAAVLEIEQVSYRRPWTRVGFMTELEREVASCLVLYLSGKVAGYIVSWLIRGEIHLLNVAVHPVWRNQGLGRFLMEHLVARGRERGARKMFLEVRVSNAAARALYWRLGFVETGRRNNYYAEEHEDALTMARRI